MDSVVVQNVLFRLPIKRMAKVTVSLPLWSLLFCFVTSMLFHFTLVNTTVCKVFNFCPSISAITGVSPQRYVWRIGVALHAAPRFLIAAVYHQRHRQNAENVEPQKRQKYLCIAKINYWFAVTEIFALIGVTYISNRENYPVHEKIFIVFMTASLSYMLSTCVVSHMGKSKNPTKLEELSRKTKFYLLALILVCSSGMCFFFYKHRFFCEELAFSWFSLCEYVVCVCNMGFHITVVWDLPDEEIVIGLPIAAKTTYADATTATTAAPPSLPSSNHSKSE